MKKWYTLLLVIFLTILLSACGIKKEVKPIVADGDKAYQEANYDKAIKLYADAFAKDDNDKIFKKMQEARKQKYILMKQEYEKKKNEHKYQDAVDILAEIDEKLKDIVPTEDKDKLKKDKKKIATLLQNQKSYDDYIRWVKPYITDLSKIGYEWMRVSQMLQFGTTTKPEIQRSLGNLIIKNQSFLGDMQAKSLNIDPGLAEAHITVLDIVMNNNSAFTASLGRLRDGRPADEVVEAGRAANDAQKAIATFKSQLTTFTEEHDLYDSFNDIVVDEKKPADTKTDDKTNKETPATKTDKK